VTRTRLILILAALCLVAGVIGLLRWRASADEPLTVTVTAASAWAAAAGVEKTIAIPIEQQLNGVENLRRLHSRCGHDGTYRLVVSFAPVIDAERALILVQNRVALALPTLPKESQEAGVTIRKASYGPLMIICVVSPDGRFDALQLSLYTNNKVKDELARLPGIAEVTVIGAREYALRVWPVQDKLKIFKLSASDVTQAIQEGKFNVTAGPPSVADAALTVTSPATGGLITAEQIEAIVIQASTERGKIRLRDVARVELELRQLSSASLDGKDTVALTIYPLAHAQPSEVRRILQAKLDDLRRQLPDGVGMFAGFDFSQEAIAEGRDYLVLDMDPPLEASPELTGRTLARGAEWLRQRAGVQNVLELSEQPFDREPDQACLVAALGSVDGVAINRERLTGEVRTGLPTDVKAVSIRVRNLSSDTSYRRFGYPGAFALIGPDRSRLEELARQLVTRMSRESRLTDVRARLRPKPALAVDFDRTKLVTLDLDLAEILASIDAFLGIAEASTGTASRATETRLFRLPADGEKRVNIETLNQLKVRTRRGQMVRLSTVAALRRVDEPAQLERIDLQPAVTFTANPSAGTTPAEARSVCERLATEVLASETPAHYRMLWTGNR
jgi:multidrug efflux pump subunit AcrB